MRRTIKERAGWLLTVMVLGSTTIGARAWAAPPQPSIAGDAAPKPPSSRAFARLSLPKRTLYVGESVPIVVQAFYAAGTGVTITGAPTANASEFTLSLGDATQGRASVGDASYLVVTWKGRLSPVKAGHYALRMSVPSSIEWRETARRTMPSSLGGESGIGDLFDSLAQEAQGGDPFAAMQRRMQQMMDQSFQDLDVGAVRKKDVVLESPGAELAVLPLPEAGRPANFTGAVGRFALDASVDNTRVRAGEPIELRLVVRGEGNFDRVNTPGLADSTELKTYPPTISQADGTKTFVQAVVPQGPGATEIPPVELAYFDPAAGRYATAKSHSIAVDVQPGRALAATGAGVVPDAVGGPALAPNEDLDGTPTRSLRPAYTRRGFWLAQLGPIGMLAAAASWVGRRRRISSDPSHAMRRRARRSLHRLRGGMAIALAADDAMAFFSAARGAIQQRLGALWGVVPEAITLVEIERRMTGSQLDTIRRVFEADAARFGIGAKETDLAQCNDDVRRVLANPEVS